MKRRQKTSRSVKQGCEQYSCDSVKPLTDRKRFCRMTSLQWRHLSADISYLQIFLFYRPIYGAIYCQKYNPTDNLVGKTGTSVNTLVGISINRWRHCRLNLEENLARPINGATLSQLYYLRFIFYQLWKYSCSIGMYHYVKIQNW